MTGEELEKMVLELDKRIRNGIREEISAKQDKIDWIKLIIWGGGFFIPAVAFAFYLGIKVASVEANISSLQYSIESGTKDRIHGKTAQAIHELLDHKIEALNKTIDEHKRNTTSGKHKP